MSSQHAPDLFEDLLQDVSNESDRCVVERDRVPLAAVIPFTLYAQWMRRRESISDVSEAGAIPVDTVTARTAGVLRVAGSQYTIDEERAAFERAVAEDNADSDRNRLT